MYNTASVQVATNPITRLHDPDEEQRLFAAPRLVLFVNSSPALKRNRQPRDEMPSRVGHDQRVSSSKHRCTAIQSTQLLKSRLLFDAGFSSDAVR